MNFFKKLRVAGNIGIIVGQTSLLFYSEEVGLSIMVVCSAINLPYFIEERDHDVVFIILVGMAINVAGLVWR